MVSLTAPHYKIATVYTSCVQRTADAALKQALVAERGRVIGRCATYEASGPPMTFFAIQPEKPVHLTHEDLGGLYDRVLVEGGERPVYLGIKAGAYLQRCPFCAHRDVTTLDHYLPKNNYPEFAVLPPNLIPSCAECNSAKSTLIPAAQTEQLFHPYYDNWNSYVLLRATAVITQYVDIVYDIDDQSAPAPIVRRAQNHFNQLNLGQLYESNAAVELVSQRERFVNIFNSGGATALQAELARDAGSRSVPFQNAWQPSLYRALAATPAFYEGGFLNIEVPHFM